jgi:uncharacterized membrane protein SirB2
VAVIIATNVIIKFDTFMAYILLVTQGMKRTVKSKNKKRSYPIITPFWVTIILLLATNDIALPHQWVTYSYSNEIMLEFN